MKDSVESQWIEVFSALASEQRLRIVEMLADGKLECKEIIAGLGLSQPAISYHLGKLERAGILKKERHGTHNCYEISKRVHGLMGFMQREDRR